MVGGEPEGLVERGQRRDAVLHLQQGRPLQPAQVGGQQVVALAASLLGPLAGQRVGPFRVAILQRGGGGFEAGVRCVWGGGHGWAPGYRSRAGGRSCEAM